MGAIGDRAPEQLDEVEVGGLGQGDERIPHRRQQESRRRSDDRRQYLGEEHERRAPALALDGQRLDALRRDPLDPRRFDDDQARRLSSAVASSVARSTPQRRPGRP